MWVRQGREEEGVRVYWCALKAKSGKSERGGKEATAAEVKGVGGGRNQRLTGAYPPPLCFLPPVDDARLTCVHTQPARAAMIHQLIASRSDVLPSQKRGRKKKAIPNLTRPSCRERGVGEGDRCSVELCLVLRLPFCVFLLVFFCF